MPAHGEAACFTISMVGPAAVVRPPSSSTPSMIPRPPAYSAPRFSTSTAQAMACGSVAPFGIWPPNTRMWLAPSRSATSTHFLMFSYWASCSSGVGWHNDTRTPAL